jgi:hypothetical protein
VNALCGCGFVCVWVGGCGCLPRLHLARSASCVQFFYLCSLLSFLSTISLHFSFISLAGRFECCGALCGWCIGWRRLVEGRVTIVDAVGAPYSASELCACCLHDVASSDHTRAHTFLHLTRQERHTCAHEPLPFSFLGFRPVVFFYGHGFVFRMTNCLE